MRSCKWQLAGLVRDGVWEEIQGGGVTFSISHWGLHHRKDLCDFCYGIGQSGQTWSLRCYNKCPQDRCWGDTCWGCHGAQDAISYTQRPPLPPSCSCARSSILVWEQSLQENLHMEWQSPGSPAGSRCPLQVCWWSACAHMAGAAFSIPPWSLGGGWGPELCFSASSLSQGL